MAKILLVEDNEMNREMLSRRLKRRGFDIKRLLEKINTMLETHTAS